MRAILTAAIMLGAAAAQSWTAFLIVLLIAALLESQPRLRS